MWWREWLKPQLVELELTFAHLPGELDGLTVGQLSDFHRGPLVPTRLIESGAELLMSRQPDLIALTGDFISVSTRYASSCAQALSGLRARLGVYAVLGNHDHREGESGVRSCLEAVGIRVLKNEALPLGGLWLAGVDDLLEGHGCLGTTLGAIPEGAFTLFLCHAPDFAVEAASFGVALQLSGHTHGGQLLLPRLGRLVLPEAGVLYPAGLAQVVGTSTFVYTNVGLGVVTLPVRYRCPPEVTVIRLRKGDSSTSRNDPFPRKASSARPSLAPTPRVL